MTVKVNLGLSKLSLEKLVFESLDYCNSMSASAYYAAAHIVSFIVVVRTSITNLSNAMNAPTSDTKTDDIKAARVVLEKNVTKLGTIVENTANDPAVEDIYRVAIVHASGMRVKGQAHPQKHSFNVKNTDVSGKVMMYAEGGVNAHEWEYASDLNNLNNRTHLRATTAGHNELDSLIPGNEYAFYHAPVTPDGPHDFEGPIYLRVI